MIFKSIKSKRKTAAISLVIVIVVVLLFFVGKYLVSLDLVSWIESLGVFGPIVFMILQILQVLLAPIPGQAAGVASGYLFGWKLGTLYTMIGTTIGSWLAFVLARKLGRPFVEKVVKKEVLVRFDKVIEEKGLFGLFFIFLLPRLPDDAVCLIAGLTKIRIRTLVLITVLGRFPGFLVLNLVGDSAASGMSLYIFAGAILVAGIIWKFRKKIEKLIG